MPATPRSEPGSRNEDQQLEGGRRQRDVLAMHRLAGRADGGAALLDWLERRTGCWAGVVDRSGNVLLPPGPPPVNPALLGSGLAQMRERGLPVFVAGDDPQERVTLLRLEAGADASSAFLAVAGAGRWPATLLTDAAALLTTAWTAERARRAAARVQLAEARCREAVLHLLMGQHVTTARQLASALSPALPDATRVHVIETSPARRSEVIARCTQLTRGGAWIVPCPVHSRHVIVLDPATGPPDPSPRPLDQSIAAEIDGCTVGAGEVVALRDTAVGYEQAFHALAVARRRPERWARFDATLELAAVVGDVGLAWADTVLAPLLGHVPARATDPGAAELTATARSWLSFSTAASRHLGIHRNTLALRVKRIEELLDLDLTEPGPQAALDLALRIRSAPRPPAAPPAPADGLELDDLLRLPAVQQWADAVLRPIRRSAHAPQLESTLRAWLDSAARPSLTAEALGLSIAGARRRLERLEQVFQRSLLRTPTARHDLWLAVRATDLRHE